MSKTKDFQTTQNTTTMTTTENTNLTTKTMTTVNLQEIASQLAQTAKIIHDKVKNSDNRFDISTNMLVKKVPELKNFDNGTIIFQARWDDEVKIEVPKVCKSYENEEVIVQLPNLENLTNFDYVSYVCGIGGYAIISVGDSNFQIGLIANLDLNDEDLEDTEGEGEPPIEVLGFEKRPEIPLRSDSIPVNEEIVVITNGKYSREHSTPLCDIRITSSGVVLKNVITNTALERLIKKYGTDGNCKFKITKKTIDKKDSSKSKVVILDLNGFDFSDLTL